MAPSKVTCEHCSQKFKRSELNSHTNEHLADRLTKVETHMERLLGNPEQSIVHHLQRGQRFHGEQLAVISGWLKKYELDNSSTIRQFHRQLHSFQSSRKATIARERARMENFLGTANACASNLQSMLNQMEDQLEDVTIKEGPAQQP